MLYTKHKVKHRVRVTTIPARSCRRAAFSSCNLFLISLIFLFGNIWRSPLCAAEPTPADPDSVYQTCGGSDYWNDPGAFTTNWFTGSAEEYCISNAQELAGFAVLVNSGYAFHRCIVRITATIDLGGREWIPVGNDTYPFYGTLDGGNYIISNLTIHAKNSSYVGLFGQVHDSYISRIRMANSFIYGDLAVGGIAGAISISTIDRCYSEGSIAGAKTVGGIAGHAKSSIILNCRTMGSVSSEYNTGGIAGFMDSDSQIFNAVNRAYITGSNYVSGVAGYIDSGVVFNSINRGNVASEGNYIGGIAGFIDSAGDIYNSVNLGSVGKPQAGVSKGGIAGFSNGGIYNCYWRTPDAYEFDIDPAPRGTWLYECRSFGFPPGTLDTPLHGTNDLLAVLNHYVDTNNIPQKALLCNWTLYQSSDGYPELAEKYLVSFDPNGGDGTQPDIFATFSFEMPTLDSISLSLTGHHFAGFSDAPKGGILYYAADGTSAHLWDKQEEATLFAVWEPNTYTVNFDANGGIGTQSPVIATYGSGMPPIQITVSRQGWRFNGYYDAPVNGKRYYQTNGLSSATWTVENDATLFAQWKRIEWSDPEIADTDWYNPVLTSYNLNSPAQLGGLAKLVKSGTSFAGKCIMLQRPVSLAQYGWSPIGNAIRPFYGTFDGCGQPITGLSVEPTPVQNNQGFFGYAGSGSLIRNVNLVDVRITGYMNVGAIAGTIAGGTLLNSQASGSIHGSSTVGGLVGNLNGIMNNNFSTATVTGNTTIGGLAGTVANSTLQYCYWLRDEGETGLDWNATGSGASSECYNFLLPPGTLNSNVFNTCELETALNVWVADQIDASPELLTWTTYNSPTGYPRLAPKAMVSFDPAGGSGDQQSIQVAFGATMPFITIVFSRPGYTFQGFFNEPDGQGKRYYLPDGSGARYWDIFTNTTLYAHWSVKKWSDPGCFDTEWYDAAPSSILFYVGTAAELAGFAKLVNSGISFINQTIVLTNHINLSGLEWQPAGSDTCTFEGSFDGDGYTVTGLTINNTTGDFQGLFGYAGSNAHISNLNLNGTSVSGQSYVGGIVGWLDGTLINSACAGSVAGIYHCGGLVGILNGSVRNCYNTANISGEAYIGGIAGFLIETLANCYNIGAVTGMESIGGIAGESASLIGPHDCYWKHNSETGFDIPAVGLGTVTRCYYFDTAPGMLDAEHAVYQTTSLLIALNDYAAANPTLISWTLTGSASGYPVFSTFKEPPNYEPDPPVPPALFSFTITGSDVTIKATDLQPGATYVLERSFSLITPQWLPLDTAVADIENNTLTFIQEHSPDEPRAFYRVRVQ